MCAGNHGNARKRISHKNKIFYGWDWTIADRWRSFDRNSHKKLIAIADKLPDAALWRITAINRPVFLTFAYSSPIWRPQCTGIPSSYLVQIGYEKTRMAGLRSGEGRSMIDSVICVQYINVTDTETDSHVSIASAAPTQCVGRQNGEL